MFSHTQAKINKIAIDRKHVEIEKTERRLDKEITICKSFCQKLADGIVSRDLAIESAKYKQIYDKLRDEIQKCDNEIRTQVNERMGQYPVCPPTLLCEIVTDGRIMMSPLKRLRRLWRMLLPNSS